MRPKKNRHIRFSPDVTYFKPQGIPLKSLEEVGLLAEELEAVRLSHAEALNQHDCAMQMGISQSTFQRILTSADRKIAEALTKGWAIRIEKA